ncbi:hypothetical protein SARC_11885 [Sphaeroforma arctica JP610]|uniref:Uncharacterized protein n=1 Tax=Sphaeroforma arctica JP610 TaxID=667725 RepID=A0A0L0FHV7_9EUKA|nr:hypothetical protein SARC_11885 [Sphaeroforma arctica JP610]KNC75593.1 hypothetical protein SARC_11885 [Sphaeroforma arctica JP610]|eukprot:XP_014149495.1 hypothetical protein SARC_11885 [Sphaeroforma arctica JP610]
MTDFVNELVHTGSEDSIDWDKSYDSEHSTGVDGNSGNDGGDGGGSDEAGDNIPDERGLPKLVPNKAFWDRPTRREHEYDHTPENILKRSDFLNFFKLVQSMNPNL